MLASKPLHCIRFFFFLSLLLLSQHCWASEALHIGHVTGIENEVITRTASGEKPLQLNDDVFFKQQILTQETGKVAITFRDGSSFEIAPKSVVILDEFIFNPAESFTEKTIRVLRGTFRYVSGMAMNGSKTDIKTPFGTAGIRGSLLVGNANGTLDLFVGNGRVTMATVNGKNQVVLTEGLGGIVDNDKATLTPEQKTAQLAEFFSQRNLWIQLTTHQSTPKERAEQAAADASANNLPIQAQQQAYQLALAAPPPVAYEIAPLPMFYSNITTNPKEIVSAFTNVLNVLYKEQSTAATLRVLEAAVRTDANDSTLVTSIVQSAVAANPRLAAAITQTAISVAPNLGVDITKAVEKTIHNLPVGDQSSQEMQNTVAAVYSAAITAQRENPATTNIQQVAITNVQSALNQGVITPNQAQALVTQLNAGNITPSLPISPNK
jgi:hypothetical protein